MKWHVPSDDEIEFATAILKRYMMPLLLSIDDHVAGTKQLSRYVGKAWITIVIP